MLVFIKMLKILSLLVVLSILNPHRALLVPFTLAASAGSWLAWRLEDLCQWVGDKVEYLRQNMWLFGGSLSKKVDEELVLLRTRVHKNKDRDGSN